MDPFTIMEMNKNIFSKNDHKIHDAIVHDPEIVLRNSIVTLSELCGVSQPSISRFCKKLGYEKYADFKYAIYKSTFSKVSETKTTDQSEIIIESYAQLLEDLKMFSNEIDFEKISKIIHGYQNIYITGTQKSFIPAHMLEINLRKLSMKAVAVTNDELDDVASIMDNQSLLIVFSVRSEKGSVGNIFDTRDSFSGTDVMLITMNPNNEYKEHFMREVVLPPAVRKDYPVRLESQVVFLIFVDILSKFLAKL